MSTNEEHQDGPAQKRPRDEAEQAVGGAEAGPAKKARTEDAGGVILQKRARDEEEHADGGAEAGPAKLARTEEAEGTGVGGGATIGDPVEAGAMDTAGPDGEDVKEPRKPDEPKKIGYKLFKDGKDAANYYRNLLSCLTQKQDLNEYEFHMVLGLLKTGHSEPKTKMGSGVRAIQVRKHKTEDSNCFYLLRTDGSLDDFSVFKCINRLFPAYAEQRGFAESNKSPRRGRGGRRGRGRRGGRRG